MANAAPAYYQFEEVNLPVVELLAKARSRGDAGVAVLDIGCGRGRLGMELERLGYRVTGVEANPVAIAAAQPRLSEIVPLDLLQFGAVEAALGGRRFDWIVASDVLEHLADPVAALAFYKRLLLPSGRVVVSVPNVALWDVRLRLLFGSFNYADSGVLDRTHLRFFTIRGARQMIAEAGFRVTSLTYDPGIARAFLPIVKRAIGGGGNPDPGAIVDSGAYRAYAACVLPIERLVCRILPGLFAFRIVMQAEPAEA